jgi:DNA-binding transcriptional LysR family regulator
MPLSLSLRQIRSLVAIAETRRIASAAKRLGLTGPALTQQIRALEAAAGIVLFDRTPSGMRPTAAGEVAVNAAREILERIGRLEADLSAVARGSSGNLSLAAVSTAKYFVPRLIAAFAKANPGISVSLTVGNRATVIDALARHAIDIALMGRPPRQVAVSATVFGDHPLVIAAAPGHPLARKRDIAKEEVAREAFLVREPGSGTRAAMDFFFADVAVRSEHPAMEMDSNETIKQAVMAGLGIAFLSGHTIGDELASGRIVLLDVVGTPIRRQWFAVTHADRTPSPAVRRMSDFLAREGARFLPLIARTYSSWDPVDGRAASGA